jgi:hypothetical protein
METKRKARDSEMGRRRSFERSKHGQMGIFGENVTADMRWDTLMDFAYGEARKFRMTNDQTFLEKLRINALTPSWMNFS